MKQTLALAVPALSAATAFAHAKPRPATPGRAGFRSM